MAFTLKGVAMPHSQEKWCFILCSLIFLTLFPQSGIAAEGIEIISPQKMHFAGQPVVFHIEAKNFLTPEEATVFYRSIGVAGYEKISMEKKTAIDFIASMKPQKVIPPGIEFFFVIKDGKGRVFTFPELDPMKNPYTLVVDLDRNPPRILKFSPGENATVQEIRPEVIITFEDPETAVDKGTIRLYVDDIDVTQLCRITEHEISYQPVAELDYGSHSVTVEMMDVCGNRMAPQRWRFTVPQGPYLDSSGAEIQLDGEYRHSLFTDKDSQEPDWNIQSSATLKSSLESGDFKTSFDGNVWYLEEQGPTDPQTDRFNLNQFMYQAQYGNQSLALGDVNVKGTELISQNMSRRGGVTSLDIAETRAEAFVLRSNTITGFRHGLGVSDPDQRLIGGSIQKDIFQDKKLQLKGTYIRGEDQNPDNYYISTLQGGTKGNLFSLAFDSQLLGQGVVLDGEYCASRYDSDVSDDLGLESDKAWRARISSRGDNYDWGTGYKYLGSDFRSIVNPMGVNDREEYFMDGGLLLNPSTFRMLLMHSRDNVDKDPLLAVIENSMGTVTYNLSMAEWPSFFMNYSLNLQKSAREPEYFPAIKNQTQTIGGGLSVNKPGWNFSPSYTFMTFDDKTVYDYDSDTHVVTLSGGLMPSDGFSIYPSFTYANLHTSYNKDVTTDTYQGALAGIISLYANALNLNTTLSIVETKNDDDSNPLHATTYSGIAQINWHLEKYMFTEGMKTLSLRGQYMEMKDHISDFKQEDYTVYAIFSAGVPITVF
jgi:hypothetical protein